MESRSSSGSVLSGDIKNGFLARDRIGYRGRCRYNTQWEWEIRKRFKVAMFGGMLTDPKARTTEIISNAFGIWLSGMCRRVIGEDYIRSRGIRTKLA